MSSMGRERFNASRPFRAEKSHDKSSLLNIGRGSREKCVFVGNLSYETTWQNLKDHMRSVGHVLRADVAADASGRSRGFGVVEFASVDTVPLAIEKLHDTQLDGRSILVREDNMNTKSSPGDRKIVIQKDSGAKGVLGVSRFVYVGNLAFSVTWQDLKDHMKKAGRVLKSEVFEKGTRKIGCGLVEFADVEGANKAILELNGTELNGRVIFVREDRERVVHGGDAAKADSIDEEEEEVRSANQEDAGDEDDDEGYEMPLDIDSEDGRGMDAEDGQGAVLQQGEGVKDGRCRLFIGNLAYTVRWYDLKDHFKDVCNVFGAQVMMEGKRSKGCGLINCESLSDAQRAIEQLHESELHGRKIYLKFDKFLD